MLRYQVLYAPQKPPTAAPDSEYSPSRAQFPFQNYIDLVAGTFYQVTEKTIKAVGNPQLSRPGRRAWFHGFVVLSRAGRRIDYAVMMLGDCDVVQRGRPILLGGFWVRSETDHDILGQIRPRRELPVGHMFLVGKWESESADTVSPSVP
jgi:hypothetical protein